MDERFSFGEKLLLSLFGTKRPADGNARSREDDRPVSPPPEDSGPDPGPSPGGTERSE